eukprot:TRINITY_DN2311_c0_g3_i1.p1 TRINITY_DN2311_c0_g3~~TRINITY_DN2311_c0_g3_i1.p1  ORF type:complete len:689 (-),score=134.22 TRINITY_DN2311_c0_g3_i1:23-2089(-)
MELLVCNATQTFVPSLLGEPGAVASLAQVMAPAAASIFCATWMWRVYSKTSGWINRSNLRRNVAVAKQLVASPVYKALYVPSEAELSQLLFQSFPDEILLEILRHVPTPDLLDLSAVNRKWMSMCRESITNVSIASWQNYWTKLDEAGDDDDVTAKFVQHIHSVKRGLKYLRVNSIEPIGENPRAMCVIGSASRLEVLKLDGMKLPKKAMKAFAHCQELRSLSIRGVDNWNLNNLSVLSKLSNLEKLDLRSISVATRYKTDSVPLDRFFPSLRKINIRCWYLPDSCYSFLPNLNSSLITSLQIAPCRILDEQAMSISRLTNLSILKLDNASTVSAACFSQFLPQLTRLSALALRSCSVTDAALCNFGKMTNLTTLELDHTVDLDGSFFSQCSAAHSKLEMLQLNHCGGLAAVDRLSFLTNLTSLDVAQTRHDAEPLSAVLPSLVKLVSLDIGDSHVSSLHLGSLKQLTKLHAANCIELSHVDVLPSSVSQVTFNHCGKLADISCLSAATCLSSLQLGGLPQLSPNALDVCTHLHAAYHVYLSNTPISAQSLKRLLDAGCYFSSIQIDNNPHFDDEMFELLCTHSRRTIHSLNVSDCPKLTNDAFACVPSSNLSNLYVGPANDAMLAILGQNSKLRSLSITQVGTATVDGILKAFPGAGSGCPRIYIQNSSFTPEEKKRLRESANVCVY